MIQQSLALEPSITDFSITLADAYFDGKSRLMWELMRHQSYAMAGLYPRTGGCRDGADGRCADGAAQPRLDPGDRSGGR